MGGNTATNFLPLKRYYSLTNNNVMLSFPIPGLRNYIDGVLDARGSEAYYWTSTNTVSNNITTGISRMQMVFDSSNMLTNNISKSFGENIRCIRIAN